MPKRWTQEEIEYVGTTTKPLAIVAKELGRTYQAVTVRRSMYNYRDRVPIVPDKKRCPRCTKLLVSGSFNKSKVTPDGLQNWCKKCNKENNKQWYTDNEAVHLERSAQWYKDHQEEHRTKRLKRKFQISPEQYEAIYVSQGGRCVLCLRTKNSNGTRLCVDHDHRCCDREVSCGLCLRGLLCTGCNNGVGFFEKNFSLTDLSSIFNPRVVAYLDSRIDISKLGSKL